MYWLYKDIAHLECFITIDIFLFFIALYSRRKKNLMQLNIKRIRKWSITLSLQSSRWNRLHRLKAIIAGNISTNKFTIPTTFWIVRLLSIRDDINSFETKIWSILCGSKVCWNTTFIEKQNKDIRKVVFSCCAIKHFRSSPDLCVKKNHICEFVCYQIW